MIDNWFWCRYSINTYNGCQFGCIYCDARSTKYHLPTDFENKIIIKNNVSSMLDQRISRARTFLPDVVVFSGTTDAYQPAENKYMNTRQCLEILLKHKYPVHICTKSTLILRDLDLLDEIAKTSWCTVSLTITATDKEKAKFLEKLAPSPQERFDVIKTIKTKSSHIQTGVLLIPTIPYLTDSLEDLEKMVKTTKESKADYLLFGGGITMRDLQGKWFINHLKEDYPELIEKYEDLFGFKYNPDFYNGRYETPRSYSKVVNQQLLNLCKKYSLSYRIKRYIPNDFRKVNYQVAEMFLNSAYKKQITAGDWKTSFWAGHEIQNLNESIKDIAARDELKLIKNVNTQVDDYLKNYLKKLNE